MVNMYPLEKLRVRVLIMGTLQTIQCIRGQEVEMWEQKEKLLP